MPFTIKSINTNPTMDDFRAIETAFNKRLDDDYAAMAAKYPEYNIAHYTNLDGLILYGTKTNRINPVEKHATSGELLFWVENQVEGGNDKVARDYLNALEGLTLKVPVKDNRIFYLNTITYDRHRQINGQMFEARPINDRTRQDADGKDYVQKGLATLLTEGKLHLHLYEDGRSNIVEELDDGSFPDES